ncbi:MAG: putative DNA binding domain-containing protein [Geobacter sp.]|nr:putative DNA binding domain-containing protein [Geobacter sp.]
MTREELRQLVAVVQRRQCELDNVEVKAARGGTPRRLFETLSAFANRPGGGVLLFGLDETRAFSLVGVGNAHRLQEELTHVASAEMEPALRPVFTVDEIDGQTVVTAEMDEVPATQKPCHYKTAGLPKGAYLRVGNTNRQMTDYEVFGYLSGRGQPTCDEEIVPGATLDDLDGALLDTYLDNLRRSRPRAGYLRGSREEALTRLRVLMQDGEVLRPTLAGLLMFGKYPQEYCPQLMITFVQYFGTTEEEKTPRGERFLDNRRFEGPISEMVAEAETYILGAMRKASLIKGVFRHDIPEYPQEALREALANAVAHRDYSTYVRGSYVQVRMFADRLEIQSPGGLFGNVTIENLEEEQSTRNARLMRMMEDMHVVENRGSGIKAMLHALRDANLEPPRFDDRRSSFLVSFRNHTLLSPEAIAWLNQFAGVPLNDRQRLALVYLRQRDQITNADYRRLNHVEALRAGQELRELAQTGLVDQHSSGRWTHYTLDDSFNRPVEETAVEMPLTDEAKIIAFVRENRSINNAECRSLLGVNLRRATYLLNKLVGECFLEREKGKRWARYSLVYATVEDLGSLANQRKDGY